MTVGIGIGSNLGNSGELIRLTFEFLRTLDSQLRVSSIYQTSPVDCPEGSPVFLNAVALMNWSGELLDLLDKLQAFEQQQGRHRSGTKNESRTLDIDILFTDQQSLSHQRLTLPHPRMLQRRFVLEPLAEIDPLRILQTGRSVSDHLREVLICAKDQVCHKIA